MDAQSAWPAVAEIGRFPFVGEFAVGVEALNAGGPIDEIKTILVVDGNRPRLDEIAVDDAALAPDELRLRTGTAAAGQEQGQAPDQRQACAARSASPGIDHRVVTVPAAVQAFGGLESRVAGPPSRRQHNLSQARIAKHRFQLPASRHSVLTPPTGELTLTV